MRQYIIIILISLHLISSNLYAVKSVLQKNNFNVSKHICSIHEHVEEHEHYHYHNSSKHSHSHNHSQINMNFADFYTYTQDTNPFNYLKSKQVFIEQTSWIPNPILESLFRPPKV
jgi:G3E family GTPase